MVLHSNFQGLGSTKVSAPFSVSGRVREEISIIADGPSLQEKKCNQLSWVIMEENTTTVFKFSTNLTENFT
jgi:hypothetical protein